MKSTTWGEPTGYDKGMCRVMLNKVSFRSILVTTALLFCLVVSRATFAYQHSCADKYQPCLDSINTQLLHAQSAEHIAALQLEKAILMAIYGYYAQAMQLLEPLIDNQYLTKQQSIAAVIYLAKVYFVLGMDEKAKATSLRAELLVGQAASESLDWALLVEYSNVLTYNGKLRQSWDVLSELLKRPQEGVAHQILADMYGNLGHLAQRLGRWQLHLEYRRKSFQNVLKTDNPQQWGIAAHNLARAYAAHFDYDDARRLFKRSIKYSLQAGDISTANYSRFRLAQMNFTIENYTIARKLLVALLSSDLSNSPLVPPKRINTLLDKIHDRMFKSY